MSSVFTLFGELKADTKQFEGSLRQAEARLKAAQAELAKTEKHAKAVGDTSATTARKIEKLNEAVNKQKTALTGAVSAFNSGEISTNKFGAATNKASNGLNSVSSRAKDATARLTDFGNRTHSLRSKIDSLSQGMTALGGVMTAAFTVPLVALGVASFKSASSLDALRNKLTAATKSIEGGSAKLKELQQIALTSAGVFTTTAADLYAYFKPMKFGEESINSLIKAFGRLQLADSKFEGMEFGRNMTQLFSQNFELQDLKQAVGQMPRFGELIAQAFNLDGSDLDTIQKGLQGLKASGKLTGEQFMQGLADAVNNDATYGLLRDTVGTRMTKTFERIQFALEPLGQAIITALEPVVDAAVPIIERMGEAFENLSQPAQYAVIAIGAIAAAIGPVVLALGSFAAAALQIGAAVTAMGGFAAIAPIVGQVAAALAAIGLAAAALYTAWQTNFGGIRDFADKVATGVQNAWASAMATISQTTGEATAAIQRYWDENGADIMAAVDKVSAFVKRALDNIAKFWTENGDTIKAIASGVWDVVKSVFSQILSYVGNVIKLIAAVINGDGSKAFDALKDIVRGAGEGAIAILRGFVSVVINVVKLIALGIINSLKFAVSEAYNVGVNIMQGLINGIKSKGQEAINSAKSIISTIMLTFATIPKISSPSKLTTEIGEYIVEGLAVGMRNKAAQTVATAQAVSKAVLAEFQKLQKTLGELFSGNDATVAGYGQNIGLRIQIAEAEKLKSALDELVKLRIELGVNLDKPLVNVSAELPALQATKDAVSEMLSTFKSLQPETDKLLEALKLFSDPNATKLIEEQAKALGLTADALQRIFAIASMRQAKSELDGILGEGTQGRGVEPSGGGLSVFNDISDGMVEIVPQVAAAWTNFFRTFQEGIAGMAASMPTIKASIGENLLNSIYSIGDIFGQAVANWDGTAKGFFSSVAQGFRQMIGQIISELIRLMVMKAVLKLIGSFAGGALGGANASASDIGGGSGNAGVPGHAAGGYISGAGTGTSDSILARLSNGEFVMPAKAVQKFGVGFMESLRNLQMPMMPAYAGGGAVYNQQRTNTFNINVSGGGSSAQSQKTAAQIRREVLAGLAMEDKRR